MHHPTGSITHTTAFVTPVVEHWLERVCWDVRRARTKIVFSYNAFEQMKELFNLFSPKDNNVLFY